MPIYILKPGQKHFKRNEGGDSKHRLVAMKPGETIRLTEKQYASFADKFDYVGRDAVETVEVEEARTTAPILMNRDDGGYDLVNSDTGVPINDVALSLAEVAEAINAYQAFVPEEVANHLTKAYAEEALAEDETEVDGETAEEEPAEEEPADDKDENN
jgi:hypothetical protein